MKLVLHHCHDARSMRTAWLLEEMGLDYDLVLHSFGPELQDPKYLAKSPAGRVPCLEMDGVPLIETGAITEILCEAVPTSLFRAPGDPERNAWLQWLHFSETMGQHLAALTQQHIVLYPEARSTGVMKLERRRLEKTLGIVDKALQGRDFLLATGFSAIDISVGYAVYVAKKFATFEDFPDLQKYHQTLTQRPAFVKLLPGSSDQRIYTRDFYNVPTH